jgi:hypothetical protein
MGASSEPDHRTKPRVRKVDWREVIKILDEQPPDTPVFVGVFDQSMRSHIKNGRFKYIDPRRYNVWTVQFGGQRTRASLFISRKP